MKPLALLGCLVALYGALLVPLTHHLQRQPFLEKVGYVPQPIIMQVLAADLRHALAAGLTAKVLIYYGTLVEKERLGAESPPDHDTMHATLVAASRLDPYNMDIYYFAQAMAWDFQKIPETTALLEYGMGYRDWDFYLPFFAGFNYAFFLQNYPAAARHYATAHRLTGSDLFARLASRYLYEGGRTDLALDYLELMIRGAANPAVRQTFEWRRDALREIRRVETARDQFKAAHGRMPTSLAELAGSGFLTKPPIDPYGGEIYLDSTGAVRTTSKFTALPEEQP